MACASAPEVPVKTITLDAPELSGPDADEYDIISYKTSHRLAQHHSACEVLRFQRPVLKRKDSATVTTTPAAFNVLDNSIADLSFLVGTLTNLCKRSIELLRPIAEAQMAQILQSQVLSMDETTIKAGPTNNLMARTAAGVRSGMDVYEVRDHSHGQAFGKIDRLVVILFLQVTLFHQDICSKKTCHLSVLGKARLELPRPIGKHQSAAVSKSVSRLVAVCPPGAG